MNDISDHVVLVTGGSTGIGRATALAFAREGANVVIADVQSGEAAVAECRDLGVDASYVPVDVSQPGDVSQLLYVIAARFGRLDYAFNNAGSHGYPGLTGECSIDNWQRTLAVNLTGAFLCMRAELAYMDHGAAIVNNSSVAGLGGFVGMPAYTAAKHGLIGLTKTAALEYAAAGIRINAICPGMTDTVAPYTNGGDGPDVVEVVEVSGRADEIAGTVLWLCSGAAKYITGQAICVDGTHSS